MQSSDYLLHTSREYSLYVAETRAIPKVADGLKHGQRMALWVLRNKSEKIKTIALSGQLSFLKYYVHGDQSCNHAINLLAAPYKNNVPLISGYGAFGSRIAPESGIGQPRYTSTGRSKAAEAFLYNDLELVPMEPNYDGSEMQPIHFLPLIPVVLLNGVNGIAVGWSTQILPHNLKDIIEATKQALQNKPIKPLAPHYTKYDISIASTGKNQWEFTGKVTIIDASTVQITELPPGFNIETFRKFLISLEDADQIANFVDRSSDRIDILVKFKRGSIAGWTEADAVKFLKLKEKVTERIVVLDWNGKSIKTYDNPETLVQEFAQWRLGWYTKRFEKMRDDHLQELPYWLALSALFDASFPQRLGKFADKSTLQDDIRSITTTADIAISDAHLDRIVNLATYRWTQEFAQEVKDRILQLRAAIEECQNTLISPDKLRNVYIAELDDLKSKKI